jgi:transposase
MMMPIKIKYTSEQAKELEQARKKNKNKNIDRRIQTLQLYGQGMPHKEIAMRTGFSYSYVAELAGKYRKGGIEAIVGNHYKGNRRNLTFEEEKALLEPFKEKAAAGEVTSVRELKKAYEKATGKVLGDNNKGQIYRVLNRHNGRKVMPRSTHPKKASPEDIEASKKLTLSAKN